MNAGELLKLPLRGTLYEHQNIAAVCACNSSNFALLMEQGTGKTRVAVGAIGYRFTRGEAKKFLIVAPLSVIPAWIKEFKACADFPYCIIDLANTKSEKRMDALRLLDSKKGVAKIILLNYEATWRFYVGLVNWHPDMIICDESQKIKSYKSKQSKAMHLLGDIVEYKLILTGTPVTQSPLDVWSQYRFLNPDIYGRNFFKFKFRYAVMGGWMSKQVVGYKDLEGLAAKAHKIAYRVTKEECLTLPPIVEQNLVVKLKGESASLYRTLEDDFGALLKSGATVTVPIVLTQMLRLQQVTGGFVKTDTGEIEQVGNEKLTELLALLDDLPHYKKVVVFCRFLPEIAAIAGSITRQHLTLTGATKDRGEVVRRFQEDPLITVLIAQIQTGGLGVTLTAADTMIFYSTTFSYADYEQAKARIHRVGQVSDKVTYIHLLAKDTIDEQVLQALKDKRDIAQYVVDELKLRLH